jgi:hypothetical protein
VDEHPHPAELLALARETLLGALADAVPAEKRYTLLMIANAMAIAGREVTSGGQAQADALADLRALYGETEGAGDIAAQLASLERRLSDDIRNGRFDGEAGERLRTLLLRQVRARLALSNPKAINPLP